MTASSKLELDLCDHKALFSVKHKSLSFPMEKIMNTSLSQVDLQLANATPHYRIIMQSLLGSRLFFLVHLDNETPWPVSLAFFATRMKICLGIRASQWSTALISFPIDA